MPNTREKLIELLACAEDSLLEQAVAWDDEQKEEHIADGDGYGFYADYLIANGVTIQKWIPVTERLPNTAERVLVCKTWLGTVYKPVYGYYQDFPNQKGCWYVLTDVGYYPQREVTHWMPLPEPPKGE